MMLGDQLNQILLDLKLIGVESTLLIGAVLLLVVGLLFRKALIHKIVYLGTVLVALYFSLGQKSLGLILSESLEITSLAVSFDGLLLMTLALLLLFPRNNRHSTEFYFLMLSMGAGASFMMKANSLLIIYLAVELVSFVSYILTSFSFKKVAHEAAIKYLLFGALSSTVMLFGLAFIYGTTGSFYLSEWDFNTFNELLPQVSLVLVIIGIFFKISIFPMQIWVPTTYQVAPVDAVAGFSIIPKLAGLILLQRILLSSGIISTHWIYSLILLMGIMTILVGTFGALSQSNARRMISFGAIAHSGFLLPFATLVGDTSQQAFWFYAFIYVVMNVSVFYLLHHYEEKGITDSKSYSRTANQVWIGAAFTVILISLVGIPPLAGFTSKFFLFSTLWEEYSLEGNTLYLSYLIIAVFATVVSLFFYLRIPYYLFLSNKDESTPIEFPISTKIIATIFAIGLLLLFFVPKLVVMIHHLLNNVHE